MTAVTIVSKGTTQKGKKKRPRKDTDIGGLHIFTLYLIVKTMVYYIREFVF